ncbi:hypothetical protein [Streptomyces sp. NPDC002851]
MLDEQTFVTPAKPVPGGKLRPVGRVTSHVRDSLTGEQLNMVLWVGAVKALPYDDDELAIAD